MPAEPVAAGAGADVVDVADDGAHPDGDDAADAADGGADPEGVADADAVDPAPEAEPAAPEADPAADAVERPEAENELGGEPPGRAQRIRRPPPHLSPNGDFVVSPPSRRPRLEAPAVPQQGAPRVPPTRRTGARGGRRPAVRPVALTARTSALTAPSVCTICNVRPRNCFFYPCGFFLCNHCATEIREGDGICPHCDQHAEYAVPVAF